MKRAAKRGFGFGITSGIITTLGILVGLYSALSSRVVVLAGILSIAVADAFSDALGIHLSEESSEKYSHKLIWKSTFATFLSKLFFAGIFAVPVLLFELRTAVIISVILGLLILGVFSYVTAKQRKDNPVLKIFEHVLIAVAVVAITYFIGRLF